LHFEKNATFKDVFRLLLEISKQEQFILIIDVGNNNENLLEIFQLLL